ncbi:hypothetical protein SBC1_31430 [Caballeronia sp. SBC1]|uniref:hypothetical protein n=1 Tax=Caballeronia sp. SBC1 TaxID=2705548 RepID=UPI00140A356A|nr:hypothetical protein [Caballeronia sp. SBC1]QIN63119.1 hypothetical protein SBC1_31430 [Caballeronia sp. SBC1]
MTRYPDLKSECHEFFAQMDALIADKPRDAQTAFFVGRSYVESLHSLRAALDNDPDNPDLRAAFDATVPRLKAALRHNTETHDGAEAASFGRGIAQLLRS